MAACITLCCTLSVLIVQYVLNTVAMESDFTEFNFNFSPQSLDDLKWREDEMVIANITCNTTDVNSLREIHIKSINPRVADVVGKSTYVTNCSEPSVVKFQVHGYNLGHADLEISVYSNNMSEHSVETYLSVVVENNRTILNDVFIVGVAVMMVVLSFGFGCRLNVHDIKLILKKPVAPAIGLCCQFILMPLLGIAITQIMGMQEELGFGLFVVSCSPGGGASNVWTVLLDGDLELSMTMTFFSKTLALGTMPLWLFAAGRLYGDISVSIPYSKLAIGLVSIAVPCILGVLLRWWKQKIADAIAKTVKILSVIFLLWLLIVGSISNFYVYFVMVQHWYILPASMMLPYLGIFMGGIVAAIFRQTRARTVTIAIETGVQDTGVAVLLLLSSFGRPAGSIAACVPIATAIFTPLPFAIAAIVLILHKRLWVGGKCQMCGGPNPDVKIKIEEISEQLGLRSTEEATFDDVCSNQYKYNCDVMMDKNSYMDDSIGDVKLQQKNGTQNSLVNSSALHGSGDYMETKSNQL